MNQFLIGAGFVLIASGTAFANTVTTPEYLQQQQNIIIQQEQQRQHERDLLNDKEPPKRILPENPNKGLTADPNVCFEFHEVTFQGSEHFSDEELKILVSGYLNDCVTLEDLQHLLSELNTYLSDLGYITTRAYLHSQDLSDGILSIFIQDGNIESISLFENEEPRIEGLTVFPTQDGALLSLRDLEQGIDQINRLQSFDAKLDLQPGSKEGLSVVDVNVTRTKPVSLTISTDNNGSDSTGVRQYTFNAVAEDFFGIYDQWNLNVAHDGEHNQDLLAKKSMSLSWSIPLGYSSIRGFSSYYKYQTSFSSSNQVFESKGNSTSHSLELDHVMMRDQVSKTGFNIGINFQNDRNYIEETYLEESSRKLSSLALEVWDSRRLGDGSLSSSLGLEQGLRILGAKEDSGLSPNDPEAQFLKWISSVQFYYPFQFETEKLGISNSVTFQYSKDELFGSEQIGAGGQYSVRGYRNNSISGDTGGYIRNEIIWYPQIDHQLFDGTNIETFIAYDAGWIRSDLNDAFEGGRVSGSALGMRVNGEYLIAEITYEKPLTGAFSFDKEGSSIRASVGIKL
ncbi:ShlB/FhaC/HecB family hemolysin secretion/activation protein [Curvivirga aplysinae]|uniref:ShlB/FhaC/HecB family hemolysin secretion/activation protein n=1 Tax=Curvivirga aplysinae TaxID=2529852 RepID=UPI0012BCF7DA|nr:ShlB/FhaC/HecB family hemolysin secretion/activation protein [Curvivirga aplysinae]MTI09938.1 ShlB/FhaC/HecB family hemolysin secretion/activation protein [Curvivirga aplysinae]